MLIGQGKKIGDNKKPISGAGVGDGFCSLPGTLRDS
jgi:hypothetical protein